MAQGLKTLTVLPGDQGLTPSTYMTVTLALRDQQTGEKDSFGNLKKKETKINQAQKYQQT